jgi:hypothetical protein
MSGRRAKNSYQRTNASFVLSQIEHKPVHKSQHQENHVSQIGKSIVSQANHTAAHGHHYGPSSPTSSPQHISAELQNGHGRNGHGTSNHAIHGVSETHYQKNGKSPGGSHQQHQQHQQQQHHHHHQQQQQQQEQQQQQLGGQSQEWRQQEDATGANEDSLYEGSGQPVVNDGKHSLLQYAMLNFRQSTDKLVQALLYLY